MFSILLITHGHVASALVEEISLVAGRRAGQRIHAVEIEDGLAVEGLTVQIEEKLKSLIQTGEVIVLTDFPIGTPFNIACDLNKKYKFIHLTGLNIPLLLRLTLMEQDSARSIDEICEDALKHARRQLCDVKTLSGPLEASEEND